MDSIELLFNNQIEEYDISRNNIHTYLLCIHYNMLLIYGTFISLLVLGSISISISISFGISISISILGV